MRSFPVLCCVLLAGCLGDLVELQPKGATNTSVDMAMAGGGSGGSGGGGDMASGMMMAMPDFGALTFTANVEPDIEETTTGTACSGAPCGCTATGCHNAGNAPILAIGNAAANYTAMMMATYTDSTGATVPVINKTMPGMSPLLLQLAPGGFHPGGQKFSGPTDPTYEKWLAWIKQGAPQ